MTYKVKLIKETDMFRCSENRINLHYYNPTAEIRIISEDIKRGLHFKRIFDVTGEITAELDRLAAEVEYAEGVAGPMVEDIVKDQEPVRVEDAKPEEILPEIEVALEDEEGIALEDLNKEELLSFIKENGMTLKGLGLSNKSSANKIRDAIDAHLTKEAE